MHTTYQLPCAMHAIQLFLNIDYLKLCSIFIYSCVQYMRENTVLLNGTHTNFNFLSKLHRKYILHTQPLENWGTLLYDIKKHFTQHLLSLLHITCFDCVGKCMSLDFSHYTQCQEIRVNGSLSWNGQTSFILFSLLIVSESSPQNLVPLH